VKGTARLEVRLRAAHFAEKHRGGICSTGIIPKQRSCFESNDQNYDVGFSNLLQGCMEGCLWSGEQTSIILDTMRWAEIGR
jgi:hypothetical protein